MRDQLVGDGSAERPNIFATSPERLPRDGTLTARVLEMLRAVEPRPPNAVIAHRTGIPVRQVRTARARVFQRGYLPPPTREQWRSAISAARGAVWLIIGRYVRMGMTASEVRLAAQCEQQRDLSYERIQTSLGKRVRHGLPLRTPEERRTARIEVLHRSPGQLERRVRLWLDAAAALIDGSASDAWPANRADWLSCIAGLEQAATISSDGAHMRGVIDLYRGSPRPLPVDGRPETLVEERRFVEMAVREDEDARALKRVLPPNEIPVSAFDREYLATRYRVRQALRAGLPVNLADDPGVYVRLDPGIKDRLADQIARIDQASRILT